MGSYVSRYECEMHYDITLNCTIAYTDNTNTSLFAIGDIEKGEFEGDPDIAGVGIFAVFIAVSATALLCSTIDLGWRVHKHFRQRGRKPKTKHPQIPGLSDFLEAAVQSCSDTQVFTGVAYAVTLRYFRGCTVTAYHYNIVANMMLLTCATHLMSITVVKDYWKYPWLALIRVLAISGVFLVTGLLLANQNADITDLKFPTEIPDRNETDSLLFMPAACFQPPDAQLIATLNSSFSSAEGFGDAILDSKPGNKIQGWDKFLVMLLWYGAALVVEVFSFFRRGAKRGGKRSKVTNGVSRAIHGFTKTFFPCCIRREKKKQVSVEYTPLSSANVFESKQLVSSPPPLGSTRDSVTSSHPIYHAPGQHQSNDSVDIEREEILPLTWIRKFGNGIHFLYMVGGVGICIWTVIFSGQYMVNLRYWVQRSGWLTRDSHDVLAEDDPTTFGQLVPICMSGLILFSLFEMLSRHMTKRKDMKYTRISQSVEDGNSGYAHRPSRGTISEVFESTRPASTRPELRYSKLHNSSLSSPPMGFAPDTPTPFSDHSTLLPFGGGSSSEVTTPLPTAASETGTPGATLSAMPERLSTPQPTASLGDMISGTMVSSPPPVSDVSTPAGDSSPGAGNNSSGASTPRPGSTAPTATAQTAMSGSAEPSEAGVALSMDEPPGAPSPLTPTRAPLPASPPPSSEP